MGDRCEEISGDEGKVVVDQVKIDTLPKYAVLKSQVDDIVKKCSWWDLYGVDWTIIGVSGFVIFPCSCILMGSESSLKYLLGLFLLGFVHSVFANKGGHLATHGGLGSVKNWLRPISVFFVENIGSFSEELAYSIHIKQHHPYTNIIGLGDSSTWKVPFLPCYAYMFIAPCLLLPPLTFLVSIAGLLEQKNITALLKYMIRCTAGQAVYIYLIMQISGLSLMWTFLSIWISRGIFSVPYIHVNIFQHIGLPMYALKHKPVRLYQMSSGVLNLSRNPVLDYAFGHSLISCHVEHHLFPNLSDNMCLKIKPVVSKFLKENGLPYHEKTYLNRLKLFLDKYETLMVKAPPITHFVGIQ